MLSPLFLFALKQGSGISLENVSEAKVIDMTANYLQ